MLTVGLTLVLAPDFSVGRTSQLIGMSNGLSGLRNNPGPLRFADEVVRAGAKLLRGHHTYASPIVACEDGCIAYRLINAISDMLACSEFRPRDHHDQLGAHRLGHDACARGLAVRCRLGHANAEVELLGILTDDQYRVHVEPSSGSTVAPCVIQGFGETEYQEAIAGFDAAMPAISALAYSPKCPAKPAFSHDRIPLRESSQLMGSCRADQNPPMMSRKRAISSLSRCWRYWRASECRMRADHE